MRQTLPPSWSADAAHIRLIAEHLDAVDAGQIDRLAIHMPPRHGKTETTTVRYGTKWLKENPSSNVLLTGYNERFAKRLGRKARNIAEGRLNLDRAKQGADEWATVEGGVLMTRGVGSPPTGTGFGRIIIDDPIRKREDAESETYREKVWDWYTDDLYTRLEPNGAIVLVTTLWHHDDVSARAVASEPGKWTVLKLPALAEVNDPLGRSIGDALWPERWPVDALERIQGVMRQNEGEASWEALYQQNPTPREGAMFKVGKLTVVDSVPEGVKSCRAWDIGSSESGDPTAGVRMSGPDSNGFFYIVHVERGRWNSADRDKKIRDTAELDGVTVTVRGPQDPGAAGKAYGEMFVKLLAGFSVRVDPVTGSKELRADPLSSQINAGNVRIVRGAWNHAFIEELRQFPAGKHDDQVDAASDAFRALSHAKRKLEIKVAC